MERAFLPVTSPNKPVELVTLPKTELVWATFCRMFLLKSKALWCACVSPRTKKNAPHTEGGSLPGNSFTWLKHLKGSPTAPAVKRILKTITWPHSMGHLQDAVLCCFFTATFSVLHSAIWSTSLNFFQSHKSYGEMQWKRVLGNVNLQSWPWDRLLRTAAHLGNISLNLLCFLY